MDEPEVVIDPIPPGEPSSPPTTRRRTVSLWTLLGATLAAVLVAFGIGYAVNADDAGAASERDELVEKLDRTVAERDRADASLALAEGAVDDCREAVQEAAALAEDAEDLVGGWRALQELWLRYLAAPVGSPEEAEIDLQVTERSLQMDSTVGALAASADRVTSDASCRAA